MLGHIAIRVVLSWALFPAMAATGTDWIFANLFWMGGDDLEEMKSGLSSQKGITMLRILNDTTKKHRTKIVWCFLVRPREFESRTP